MCQMCWKYKNRLVLSPINRMELIAWNLLGGNMRLFRFWHKWFVKD